MGARPTPQPGSTSGNFIAEWFGHRVWPTIDGSPAAVNNQTKRRCPFLSFATGEERQCIKVPRKGEEPTGVCTISSDSNGVREDWLACPYRTLDQHFTLLGEVVRTLYRVPLDIGVYGIPVTILDRVDVKERVAKALATRSHRVFLFTADKLGGEVDLPETDVSPGAKVDVSIIEVLSLNPLNGQPEAFGQHVFYEIQTSDFHGSPLHAVHLLQELCPANTQAPYHDVLRSKKEIAGTGVEGPNKANVFKRTFYQMILKVQLAEHPLCAGFAIILPLPVWNSWLRHFANPNLVEVDAAQRVFALAGPEEKAADVAATSRSWIFVFDVERDSKESPQPLFIARRLATSASALMHQAFTAAALQGIAAGVIDRYRGTLEARIRSNWSRGQ